MGLINWLLGLGKKSKPSKNEELKEETRTIQGGCVEGIVLNADESNKSLASYLEFLVIQEKLYRGKVVDRFIKSYKAEDVNIISLNNLIFEMTPEILKLKSDFVKYKISCKDDSLGKLIG